MIDYSRLLGKIVEKYHSRDAFGKMMGWHPATTSYKLTGKSEWKQGEVLKACGLLGILIEEIPVYFFNEEDEEDKQRRK